jgi:hypothetical protein
MNGNERRPPNKGGTPEKGGVVLRNVLLVLRNIRNYADTSGATNIRLATAAKDFMIDARIIPTF